MQQSRSTCAERKKGSASRDDVAVDHARHELARVRPRQRQDGVAERDVVDAHVGPGRDRAAQDVEVVGLRRRRRDHVVAVRLVARHRQVARDAALRRQHLRQRDAVVLLRRAVGEQALQVRAGVGAAHDVLREARLVEQADAVADAAGTRGRRPRARRCGGSSARRPPAPRPVARTRAAAPSPSARRRPRRAPAGGRRAATCAAAGRRAAPRAGSGSRTRARRPGRRGPRRSAGSSRSRRSAVRRAPTRPTPAGPRRATRPRAARRRRSRRCRRC